MNTPSVGKQSKAHTKNYDKWKISGFSACNGHYHSAYGQPQVTAFEVLNQSLHNNHGRLVITMHCTFTPTAHYN